MCVINKIKIKFEKTIYKFVKICYNIYVRNKWRTKIMLLKEYEKNTDLELHHSDSEGYVIKSKKTGLIYDLLEMVSYGGKASSDIVMISIANENEGYIGMLDYIFGASDKVATLDFCLDLVNDFEKGLKKPIDIMGIANGIADKIIKK